MTEYSAVIPAFNRARLLRRAIFSAVSQSRPAKEIIVVDDASTDGTAEMLARLSVPSLRVIRHAVNRGPAAARNTGVENAHTPFIAFLDSDDEWAPKKAERQFSALASADPATRGGVTGYAIHDIRNGRTTIYSPGEGIIAPKRLLLGCPLNTGSTLMIEREAFLVTGGFEPGLRRLENWDWLMRYQRRYGLQAIPTVLATIQKSGDPSRANVTRAVLRLRDLHGAHWRQSSLLDSRKFESSLAVEEAASAYLEGDRRTAMALALRAIAAYPFRGWAFYGMLARRLLQARRPAAAGS